ncbi:MAG: Gfo/Idh/MocA family oxidoreductase [Anaerolineae bacterium]|nr:Gfo/Idh/MocA family oxidoreductase [Anaerolineae bacterium]
MSKSRIGIGVIGLGRMGHVYGSFAASQHPDARLVAISDNRPEVMTEFADRISGLKTYTDYHDLLADPNVQGVIVVTPTHTHREVVIAAAEAGKAIFCEKPTALTLAATDDMIAAVEKAGVMFQVGFMRRFDKAYAAAKQQIDAGAIGDPVVVRSIGRDPFATSLEYANPAVSGGLILDMGIHDFDLLRWLMNDEIDRVYSEVASLVYPELLTVGDVDNAMINVRFARGGLGNVEVSRTAHYGYDIQANVIGTKGALQIGYLQETAVTLLNRQGGHYDIVPYFKERFGPAYTAQIAHFVDCIRDQKAPSVSPKDARAALQAALAATQSQHTGAVVRLAEVS